MMDQRTQYFKADVLSKRLRLCKNAQAVGYSLILPELKKVKFLSSNAVYLAKKII